MENSNIFSEIKIENATKKSDIEQNLSEILLEWPNYSEGPRIQYVPGHTKRIMQEYARKREDQ